MTKEVVKHRKDEKKKPLLSAKEKKSKEAREETRQQNLVYFKGCIDLTSRVST